MKAKNRKVKVEFKTKNGDSIFVDATKTYEPERSKREDYILHLRCEKCHEVDLVFTSKAKEWKCPHCEFRCGALNMAETS